MDNSHADGRCNPIQFGTQRGLGKHGQNPADVGDRHTRSLGDEAASFVEPLACCHRAVRRLRSERGDTGVVVGLGSIGCLFVQLLVRGGVTVIGVDRLPERTALARRLGATIAGTPEHVDAAARALSEGRGADET